MGSQPANIAQPTDSTSITPSSVAQSGKTPRNPSRVAAKTPSSWLQISRQEANRILISLMFASLIMPLASSMTRVALPEIRDDFLLSPDMTAWVSTAFTLPFMVLMPVYGRLGDGVGKRRLILAGIALFALGTLMTIFGNNLGWIMIGRAIQGFGMAGMTPLGMALISAIFPVAERGKALGTWSSIGPITAFSGPLLAGFLVDAWGWRAAYWPPLVAAAIALLVVSYFIPAGISKTIPGYFRHFDWIGVGLLTAATSSFLFYLSSRPITGVAPLRDWRLFALTVLFAALLIWWENRRDNPFIQLTLFRNQFFRQSSFYASIRMFTMSGVSFLIPLYLVDIYNFRATYIGIMLMIMPGCMSLTVRFGGQIADKWGSRWPIIFGLSAQFAVTFIFALPSTVPLWAIVVLLACHGLGAGTMLAALHRASLSTVAQDDVGSAAGLYSMIRFAGMAIGTALAGVLLQLFLDQSLATNRAYQLVYIFFAVISLLGLIGAVIRLREPTPSPDSA